MTVSEPECWNKCGPWLRAPRYVSKTVIGNPSLFTYENDTGPDGANHDRDGIFVMSGAPDQPTGKVEGLRLVDVGPTILSLYDIEASTALPGAAGRSFLP